MKSFFLVGHSFGGGLALAFSSRRPESVRMLVLCDAAVIRQERLSLRQKIAKIMSSGKGLVLSLPLVGKPIYSISQKILYHLAGVADYRRASETMKKTFISVTGQDLSGFASGVKVPVLIIWGEKDKSTPVEDAYTLQHLIPGSIVEIIKNIGHNPHRQDSERLAGLIAGFFTSN